MLTQSISTFKEKYGFGEDGKVNEHFKGCVIYGNFAEVDMCIFTSTPQERVRVRVYHVVTDTPHTNQGKEKLKVYGQQVENILMTNYRCKWIDYVTVDYGGIDIFYKESIYNITITELENILRAAISLLKEQQLLNPTCQKCGDNYFVNQFMAHRNFPIPMCPQCMIMVLQESKIDNEQRLKKIKGNYFTGFLGALLGGLIGSLGWVAFWSMGYISTLGAVTIAGGAYLGYKIGKGKTNIGGAAIIAITALIVLVGVQYGCVSIDAYHAINEGLPASDEAYVNMYIVVTEVVPYGIMYIEEIRTGVLEDLLFGLFFLVLLIIGYGKMLLKSGREQKLQIDFEEQNPPVRQLRI